MNRNEYITDQQVVKRVQAAVRIELEKKKALDRPAVIYDRKTKMIYHVHSDGSRTEKHSFRFIEAANRLY